VRFTEWTTALSEETLTLQILMANRALEALRVIVVVAGLYPAVTGLDRKSTAHTLSGKQLVPIFLAVWKSILQVEVSVAEWLVAIRAGEALGVELLLDGVQTIPFNPAVALGADWSQELFVAGLAVQLTALLYESDVLQWSAALGSGADEMIRAPRLTKSGHKRTSNGRSANSANGNPSSS
jgi:hypothetical protein